MSCNGEDGLRVHSQPRHLEHAVHTHSRLNVLLLRGALHISIYMKNTLLIAEVALASLRRLLCALCVNINTIFISIVLNHSSCPWCQLGFLCHWVSEQMETRKHNTPLSLSKWLIFDIDDMWQNSHLVSNYADKERGKKHLIFLLKLVQFGSRQQRRALGLSPLFSSKSALSLLSRTWHVCLCWKRRAK